MQAGTSQRIILAAPLKAFALKNTRIGGALTMSISTVVLIVLFSCFAWTLAFMATVIAHRRERRMLWKANSCLRRGVEELSSTLSEYKQYVAKQDKALSQARSATRQQRESVAAEFDAYCTRIEELNGKLNARLLAAQSDSQYQRTVNRKFYALLKPYVHVGILDKLAKEAVRLAGGVSKAPTRMVRQGNTVQEIEEPGWLQAEQG